MTGLEILTRAFSERHPQAHIAVRKLAGEGSGRQYYLFEADGGDRRVGVVGTDARENNAFISLARQFDARGIPVPRDVEPVPGTLCYFQEYVEGGQLFGQLDNEEMLMRTMRELARLQYAPGIDFSVCYPEEAFDEIAVMRDLNYFKYSWLNVNAVPYDETLLDREFAAMARRLAVKPQESTFMYRDFQSRNVLIDPERGPVFIDFQGGRRGPALYDVASFVSQARAGFSDAMRRKLVDAYLEAASRYADLDAETERERLQEYMLLRMLQTLGAYGLRGIVQRKPHFIKSIPAALANLRHFLETSTAVCDSYPHLAKVLRMMVADAPAPLPEESPLTVHVQSFSFKKGYPEDASGNGGGFVFDCRGMENPGRYAEYKQLTGRDRPVIDFLEQRGEIQPFVDQCFATVAPAIENYIRRGFTSLSISFGCTGGQHRSVYSADRLGRLIKQMYPCVSVAISHREQPFEPENL